MSDANDGANTSIHLAALAPSSVAKVQFSIDPDGAGAAPSFNVGSPVAPDASGVFSLEYTPTLSQAVSMTAGSGSIAVTATGLDVNDLVSGTPDTVGSLAYSATGSAAHIATTPGSSVGAYANPGALGGTWVGFTGTSNTSAIDPGSVSDAGVFTGGGDVSVGSASGGIYPWIARVDVGSLDAAPAANQALLGVTAGTGESDDVVPVNLYAQTVTGFTSDSSSVTLATGEAGSVTLTVKDQNGAPIAGADVYKQGGTVQHTDGLGQTTGAIASGDTGTVNFFVDVDGSGTYTAGDKVVTVTVNRYTPKATTLVLKNNNGSAYDKANEFDNTKFFVMVEDQNGNPFDGADVNVTESYTDLGATTGSGANHETVTSGDAGAGTGKAELTQPGDERDYTVTAYIDSDGVLGESAGDIKATPITFKSGAAEIVWADGAKAQRGTGVKSSFDGTLELADGTGLGGRVAKVNISGIGAGENAVFASSQPAGTTRESASQVKVTTGSNGGFSVSINDAPQATPPASENEEHFSLDPTFPYSGGASPRTTNSLAVDLLNDLTPAFITFPAGSQDITGNNPGEPTQFTLQVESASHTPLTDVSVDLSLDHGYFTATSTNTSSAANGWGFTPANRSEGSLFGDWVDHGQSMTVTTDDNGQAIVAFAIGRDAGFDNDGAVNVVPTATAGPVTQNHTAFAYTTGSPLNPGAVVVAPVSTQESTILPDARTDQSVGLNVATLDQFGNPVVSDGTVATSDDTASASLANTSTHQSDYADVTTWTATASAAGDQKVTSTWTPGGHTAVWHDSDPSPTVTNWVRDDTGTPTARNGSYTISWYAFDAASSSFTLTHDTKDVVEVGTVVTETLTAKDQHGQPMSGFYVQFFRSGPTPQDGTSSANGTTDGNGQLFFSYAGTGAGTADVTATVSQSSGSPVLTKVTDSVTFKEHITAVIRGRSIKHHRDLLKVVTSPDAAGTVVVFKRGHHRIGTAVVSTRGIAKLRVRDRNGRHYSRYHAHVRAGSITFPTNTRWIKIR